MSTPKFREGASLYPDDYWGRVRHSYKLYHPKNLIYSDEQLLQLNKELKEYLRTGVTTRTNEELWNIYYILKGNLHPETEKPVNKVFRWSAYVPANIPLIIGISVLPPTTFNQIFFQSLNQSYNFGNNVCNASAANQKTTQETLISYFAAITSAIVGSAGLRHFLLKKNFQGPVGKGLLLFTPYIGLIFASSVNLFFSRSKEVLEGIPINHPATNEQMPSLKSKVAAWDAFFDSWLIRVTIPIPLFVVPMVASRWAAKNTQFYKKTVPKLLFDASVVGATIWTALVFVISGFSTVGSKKLKHFEPHIKQALKDYPEDTDIKFNKGL